MKTPQKNKIFSALLALALAFSILSFFPARAGAQGASPDDERRCREFKDKFKVANLNIVDGLPEFCSATQLITGVISYALVISGVVTVLFLIVGGFWYLTSAGSEEQAEKGKKTLINSVIGLVVITLAFAIVKIVASTLTAVPR